MNPEQLPLRDIQLPSDSLWWPLAPGWWVLIILCVLMISYAWVKFQLRRKLKAHEPKPNYTLEANILLAEIQARYLEHSDKQTLAQEISELLRRLLLQTSQQEIAGLTGNDWLSALDLHFGLSEEGFRQLGTALTEAPYKPDVSYDADALINLTKRALSSENIVKEAHTHAGV